MNETKTMDELVEIMMENQLSRILEASGYETKQAIFEETIELLKDASV